MLYELIKNQNNSQTTDTQSPETNNSPSIQTPTTDNNPTSQANIQLKPFNFETVKVNPQGDITKRETKQGESFDIDIGNGITLEMVKIAGGSFLMGSPSDELERNNDETQHQESVRDFYIAKYQTTQAQWQAIMGNNPSDFNKGGKYPVESVSWNDAQEFCQKLTQKTGLTFRLPTEAEWEYACRAGTTTPFYYGETLSTEIANYDGNSTYGAGKKGIYRGETTEVGSFPANGWGLYDMHGNLWEWCQDDYREDYQSSNKKVLRGGSWFSLPWYCRCAFRSRDVAGFSLNYIGFRVVFA
jgi:formylglycine-generating enzyme required for sulfatase activity